MRSRTVILLHGLGENSTSMGVIEACLLRAGYEVYNLNYPYQTMGIEQLVSEWMPEALAPFQGKTEIHFVTHSLGGILVRGYLNSFTVPNLGQVVMFAPPNQGSPIMDIYRLNPLFVKMMGPASEQLGTDRQSYPLGLKDEVDYPLGIIAGCIAYDPVSYFVMAMPHDGRLPVRNTRLKGMKDHITVPSGHELIIANPIALFGMRRFLEVGSFRYNQVYSSAKTVRLGRSGNNEDLGPRYG